jgi:hypothetical protein
VVPFSVFTFFFISIVRRSSAARPLQENTDKNGKGALFVPAAGFSVSTAQAFRIFLGHDFMVCNLSSID